MTDEKVTIKLRAEGNKLVSAKDFNKQAEVEIIDPDHHIATLDKGAKLKIDAIVETGKGYLPTENREEEKMPLGFINIDAIFTPIKKINYTIEDTRVGQKTDYDKIIFEITTDGSIDPEDSLNLGAQILAEHFSEIVKQTTVSQTIQPKKKTNRKKTTRAKTKKKK